ncbi:MAG: hypothetical protein LBH43_06555 [Treponema sp.]|jgi:hypothetical protein|nr:hypothetical protein [Treponema sp.]
MNHRKDIAIAQVKSKDRGAKTSGKKLTTEKLKHSGKRRFLEGEDGVHRGGEKENQSGIRQPAPEGRKTGKG